MRTNYQHTKVNIINLKITIMKKTFFLLISILCSCIINAVNVKSTKINIDLTGIMFPRDSYGQVEIAPACGIFAFNDDENYPCLPFYPVSIYIESGKDYVSSNLNYKKTYLFNCTLAPVPEAKQTSQPQNIQDRVAQYSMETYPNDNVRYVGESQLENGKILYFNVCPFIYDGKEKKLYVLRDIQLDIAIKENTGVKSAPRASIHPDQKELMEGLVCNANDINWDISDTITEWPYDRLDYAIITNKELANAFAPLVEWKKQKGVWTEVFTVEDIEKLYTATSTQEKIKLCLYDLYRKRGLKYVLLGGDNTVVPVRYCRNVCKRYNEEKMPTDLYYSCFGGDFSWDANGNGFYGEPTDNIDLFPSLYLSRLPVRTNYETENYIKRLLSYEQMKAPSAWTKKMLACGYTLGTIWENHSDSECYGDKLYKEYIKDYWNGERKKLYDTYNDFGYERVYYETIQNQLSAGYAFADFIMHGDSWCFNMISDGYYTTDHAAELENSAYTIITTTSCCTNAFDDSQYKEEYKDPCLSESFIRNPSSGIIAYWGCSRSGWDFNRRSSPGPSFEYDASFYQNLFSDRFQDKNFGKIIAAAKADMIPFSKYENLYRYLHFGLNPIGDPEMPVFTDTPQKFTKATVKIENNELKIDTGVDSCTICVMSRCDEGKSFYKVLRNVKNVNIDYNVDSLTLCITKQNYIPFFVNDVIKYAWLTNPISGGNIDGVWKNPGDEDISIKYHIAENSKNANIVVSSYDGTETKRFSVSENESKLNIESNSIKKGIISISLFVNSKLADSITFNNK